MTEEVKTPIVIDSAQGMTDAMQAAIRYLVVIVGFLSGLGALIGQQDATAAVTYVQSNLGGAVAAVFGLVALGTAIYGIYKSWKRGQQLNAVEPHAPDSVIQVKD